MQVILIILSLIFSAFFAGSETAFVVTSRIRLEVLVKRKIRGAKLAYAFITRPESFIITTLVGTNISIVLCSSLAAVYLEDFFTESVIIAITSTFILLFGEILPKAIFREIADRLIIHLARPLRLFLFIFYPINWLLNVLSSFLARTDSQKNRLGLSKRELEVLIRESEKKGVIEKREREIISKVFLLSRQRVKEAMIPRTDIVAIKQTDPMDRVCKKCIKSGYSRVPVYGKDLDDIVGVIYIKDLFDKPKNLNQILRKILFVPENKKSYDLLKEFRKTKSSIAVVVDEYGGTAGLVTLEDIVEELFGQIEDEHDTDEKKLYKRLEDGSLIVNARLEIDDANERLGLKLPRGGYETLGGLMIEKMRKIPQKDEYLEINNYKLIVLQASKNRVQWVRIEKLPASPKKHSESR